MTPAPRPTSVADDPRYMRPEGNRRVRRRRRARSTVKVLLWLIVWIAGAGAAGLGFSEGWRMLMDPERFPLRRVIVEGGGSDLDREVEASMQPLLGRNLFSIDLKEAARLARSHPRVRSASVQRRLPAAILAVVTPRKVEALALSGDGIHMVDEEGADLGLYEPRWAGEDHPIITGAVAPTREETLERVVLGVSAIRRLREEAPETLSSLSALDVSRRDRITATLRDFGPPVYLSPEDPLRNIERLEAVRGRLSSEQVDAEYVDCRFRDRIAVMPIREGERRSG